MSLWTRFTVRRKARKAERQAIAAKTQQDRVEADASFARALAAHKSSDGGVLQTSHMVLSHTAYHGSSGIPCNPDVSGNCSGMGV